MASAIFEWNLGLSAASIVYIIIISIRYYKGLAEETGYNDDTYTSAYKVIVRWYAFTMLEIAVY